MQKSKRTIQTPRRYNDSVVDIPVFSPVASINFTNTKTCRLCIRHKIPALMNENYLPAIVLDKINTHSFQGFTKYAKNYIINNYNTNCNIANCYSCNFRY